VKGVAQHFELRDTSITVRAQYARFADPTAAQRAAEFHTQNVAGIFKKEPWREVGVNKIGDEAWFSDDSGTSAAILFTKDNVCVLVSCTNGDVQECRKIAVALAQKIIARIVVLHQLL